MMMMILFSGGGQFRMTMTVDKNVMESEKIGLGN
jgi:hypothetical protein